MRKAVYISVAAHGLVMLLAFISVSFRQVTYMPRETYRVRLVSAAVAEPAPAKEAPPAPPKEETPPPVPKEEPKPKEEEPTVPDKPKPKPKPAETDKGNQEVPRAQITKSDTASTAGEAGAEATPGTATGGISFDGGDFPYDAFIARMRSKIAAAWQVPAGAEGVLAEVEEALVERVAALVLAHGDAVALVVPDHVINDHVRAAGCVTDPRAAPWRVTSAAAARRRSCSRPDLRYRTRACRRTDRRTA